MMTVTANLPIPGSIASVQVPGAHIQLAKIIENRAEDGMWWTLVCWIDIRRDAEWVPSSSVPIPTEAQIATLTARVAELEEALLGMVATYDRLTRYGSPLAKAANESYHNAISTLNRAALKETGHDPADGGDGHG